MNATEREKFNRVHMLDTCAGCGEHKNVFRKTKLCARCNAKLIKEKSADPVVVEPPTRAEKIANTKIQNGADKPLTILVPADLYQRLAAKAEHEFREPSMQALWFIRDSLP